MMKRKLVKMVALGCLFALPVGAQTVYDAAKMTDKDLNGTARFVSMGGAMGALGGDISTISTNPAGIGIYRSSEVMTTFGMSAFGTEAKYAGESHSSDKYRADFNNIGLVYATKIGNVTPLRFVNVGFNYKRAKSFYRNMEMAGNLGPHSQTYQMAAQADGIFNWENAFDNVEIGWLSALGYNGYMIDPQITTNVTDFPYKDKDGNQLYDKDGKPLYINHDLYLSGASDGGIGHFRSEERGGIDQYDFNVAFNFNDRFYLGATLGAYVVNYQKYTFYSEDHTRGTGSLDRYELQSWNKIKGNGFDLKLGAIVRPFAESPFRIGVAIHTPVFYDLDYKTHAYLASDIHTDEGIKVWEVDTRKQLPGGGDMVRSFKFRTPWIYQFSLGHTVGTSLALGAEYEYQDYSTIDFRSIDGYDGEFDYENSTTAMLKGVHTLRLGLEYKVIPQFALRAGYNFRTSLFKSDAYKDLPYYSIQSDTDFSNTESLSHYTLGVGYRSSSFYADLAYKFSTYKSDFYPFVNYGQEGDMVLVETPEATKVTDTRSQVLLTLGFRF